MTCDLCGRPREAGGGQAGGHAWWLARGSRQDVQSQLAAQQPVRGGAGSARKEHVPARQVDPWSHLENPLRLCSWRFTPWPPATRPRGLRLPSRPGCLKVPIDLYLPSPCAKPSLLTEALTTTRLPSYSFASGREVFHTTSQGGFVGQPFHGHQHSQSQPTMAAWQVRSNHGFCVEPHGLCLALSTPPRAITTQSLISSDIHPML